MMPKDINSCEGAHYGHRKENSKKQLPIWKIINHRTAAKTGIATLVILALAVAGYYGYYYAGRVQRAVNVAETEPIRELVIAALNNLKIDAPVDPKTGDTYFPEAKLFVPNQGSPSQLTYSYYKNDDGSEDISVGSNSVNGGMNSRLYSATNVNELFERIPKAQSCLRGVRVRYSTNNIWDEPNALTLKDTHTLNNGKTVYLYQESSCPELDDTASLLKNLQSY